MNIAIKISVFTLSTALFLSSCSSEGKREQSIQSVEKEFVSEKSNEVKEETIKKIFYNLPSPLEITMMFKKEGVEYNGDILHLTSKRQDYNSTLSKALNLGIYGGDLSYSGLFAKHEAAIK